MINNPAVDRGRDVRQQICAFIVEFTEQHGYPPTKMEIGEAVGVSVRSITRHINKLLAEGRVTQGPGPRTLRVT